MADIASFWVGDPLTKIEKTCLSSFVANNHKMTLFVYDMDLEVPDGVIKENASQIIDKDRIFKVDNSYGPFADMFRYKMIKDTGYMWTDTDNICLRSDWDFPEYVFGEQGGNHDLCANGIIKAPKDSDFINELVDISDKYDKTKIVWGEIGPQLLTATLKKYGLEAYRKPPQAFYPVDYWNWKYLWNIKYNDIVFEASKNSYTIQIWNQMLSRDGRYTKNNLPKGSIVDYFYKRYLGNEN